MAPTKTQLSNSRTLAKHKVSKNGLSSEQVSTAAVPSRLLALPAELLIIVLKNVVRMSADLKEDPAKDPNEQYVAIPAIRLGQTCHALHRLSFQIFFEMTEFNWDDGKYSSSQLWLAHPRPLNPRLGHTYFQPPAGPLLDKVVNLVLGHEDIEPMYSGWLDALARNKPATQPGSHASNALVKKANVSDVEDDSLGLVFPSVKKLTVAVYGLQTIGWKPPYRHGRGLTTSLEGGGRIEVWGTTIFMPTDDRLDAFALFLVKQFPALRKVVIERPSVRGHVRISDGERLSVFRPPYPKHEPLAQQYVGMVKAIDATLAEADSKLRSLIHGSIRARG